MFFPGFEEKTGLPAGFQNGHFSLSNHGWEWPKLWVKLRVSGGGAGNGPRNGVFLAAIRV